MELGFRKIILGSDSQALIQRMTGNGVMVNEAMCFREAIQRFMEAGIEIQVRHIWIEGNWSADILTSGLQIEYGFKHTHL